MAAAEVLWGRYPLPVPGAWMYERRGDVVIVLFDDSFTDEEVATRVALVEAKFALPRPADSPG